MTTGTDEEMRIAAAQRDPSRFGDLYEENFLKMFLSPRALPRRTSELPLIEDDVLHSSAQAVGCCSGLIG